MVLKLALPFPNCVNLDIILQFPVAQFLYLKNGNNNSIYLAELS